MGNCLTLLKFPLLETNHHWEAETVYIHVSLHLFISYLHIMGHIDVGRVGAGTYKHTSSINKHTGGQEGKQYIFHNRQSLKKIQKFNNNNIWNHLWHPCEWIWLKLEYDDSFHKHYSPAKGNGFFVKVHEAWRRNLKANLSYVIPKDFIDPTQYSSEHIVSGNHSVWNAR